MTKKKRSTTVALAFDAAWLEAGAERARALVDEAGDRGAALVEAWVQFRNAAAVAEVAGDDEAPAAARKAARRGINVLKSRGVAIPERDRMARHPRETSEVYEAWFRPPDGAGTSAFTLGARAASGRYRLVDIIIKSEVGLVSVAGMEMSRTQLRETFEGIEKRFGHRPAPVPIAWARSRILAARSENEEHRTVVPLGFSSHRDLIGEAPAVVPPHPADEAMLEIADGEGAVARSNKLHAEPELRGWLPDPPSLQQMLLEVQREVPVVPGDDTASTEAKVRAVIERATDRFFGAQARDTIALRMKDAAISMVARDAKGRAAEVLATAGAIRALSPATPAHTIPFLLGFFEKAFGLAAARVAARQGP